MEAKVRFNGCEDDFYKEVAVKLPYAFRPHEAEAFAREGKVGKLLLGSSSIKERLVRVLGEKWVKRALGL